ncbi:unnamed protein product [Litomosoides sigmodontis]|uniref:Uncharacterized protein n=1 Tax=Litomosoides sigmodontis TaxID=42156 RepID=A0A3P6RYJ9_LITSI|nr:unnamed protein product [Litomosoides sigmodontis]
MADLFLDYWIWYVVLVFMPISILLVALSIAAYIYFFTSCTLVDFYSEPFNIFQTQDLLGSHNDGRPRLMSRFLTENELQKVFTLPEYTARGLDLTLRERQFLNKASKVHCVRSDEKVAEDYLNFIDATKFIH